MSKSLSSCWFVRLSNAFVFQIQILQWSTFCIDDHEFVANLNYGFFCNIIIVNRICCIVLLFCYIYVLLSYILEICLILMHMFLLNCFDCILLSLLALSAILLTSSVNKLCFSLLNLCSDFNINFWLFYEFFMILSKTVHNNFNFSSWFILFSSWVASKQFL